MKIEQFVKLPELDDGRKVVTLMSDASMVDETGAAKGFLSLVPNGANGRRIQAAKAEAPAGELQSGILQEEVPADPKEQPFAKRILEALGLGALVRKAEGTPPPAASIDFDAAIAVPAYWDGFWQAERTLCDTLAVLLRAEGMSAAEKRAQAKANLESYTARVMELFEPVIAVKAEHVQAIGVHLARKRGDVITAADLGTLSRAADVLRAIADPTNHAVTAKQEEEMDVKALAVLAGEAAIEVARKAGITDPAELNKIGQGAVTELVAKAAVEGPPQPGLTPGALANQLSMAGFSGSPGNMEAKIMGAINGIGALVKKEVGEALDAKINPVVQKVDAIHADLYGKEADGKKEPGLRGVVEKTAELVHKMAGTPVKPKAGGDPEPEGKDKDGKPVRATAKKGDFSGTAFDLSGLSTRS